MEHVIRDIVNPSLETWMPHPCGIHSANVPCGATHQIQLCQYAQRSNRSKADSVKLVSTFNTLALALALILVFQTGNAKAIGKGGRADKQKLSGMDAASQPPRTGSRRFCVQPILPDRIV
jgi:hypothetical protein